MLGHWPGCYGETDRIGCGQQWCAAQFITVRDLNELQRLLQGMMAMGVG